MSIQSDIIGRISVNTILVTENKSLCNCSKSQQDLPGMPRMAAIEKAVKIFPEAR
ncbi:MAG: hypothetical protein ACK4HG_10580 [Agrobacterium albertimagni]